MKNVEYYKKFFLYLKLGETTYFQKNRKKILNRAKDYYENNEEILRDKARNKCRELSVTEKKRENMEEIDILICLKKRGKN